MFNFTLDPEATYLVACTYGADSMALLDMLLKKGAKPVVVSLDYHKFDSSPADFAGLEAFCKEKGLPFELLDAAKLPEEKQYHEGQDFKAWARKTRYDFFKEIYKKYDAKALYLAHQQDDLLADYLRQKRLNKFEETSFSEVRTVRGMVVIRPLIHYSHEDLVEYNRENQVPYSRRSDAFEAFHVQDPIRQEIADLNEIDRGRLEEEMQAKNENQLRLSSELQEKAGRSEELEIRALFALPRDDFSATLIRFVNSGDAKVHLGEEDIQKIRQFLLTPQASAVYKLKGNTHLVKQYDVVFLGRRFDKLPYSYTLEKPGKLSTEQFDLDFSMGAEDRFIKESDYPLTIRTALPADTFVFAGYLMNVLEAYSSWKMPVKLRYVWPVFVNKDGKIVYVPRYREHFQEYHSSILQMHIEDKEQ